MEASRVSGLPENINIQNKDGRYFTKFNSGSFQTLLVQLTGYLRVMHHGYLLSLSHCAKDQVDQSNLECELCSHGICDGVSIKMIKMGK